MLAGDKNSRLYQRLVKDTQLATAVNAEIDNREIGGQFYITADVKPGGDVERVEKIVGEELDKLLAEGPTEAEIDRQSTRLNSRHSYAVPMSASARRKNR